MPIVDDVLSCIVSCCFDTVAEHLKSSVDKKKLLKELTDRIYATFDCEIFNTDLTFDLQGFLEYLKTDAVEDIKVYLRELDSGKSDIQKKAIVSKAIGYSSSQGQKDSEELAKKLMKSILEIVTDFYTSKVETGELIALKSVVRQNGETIMEHADKIKEEIITVVKSTNLPPHPTEPEQKYLTYPPEHLNSETYAFREHDVSLIIKELSEGKKKLFLNGLGGVGKTTIAKDLYHILKDRYSHVAWISYQENLSNSILSSFLDFSVINEQRLEKIINFLLSKGSDLLLIIDNVTNSTAEDNMLKTFAGMDATVLLTTRLNTISAFSEHTIDTLKEEQAAELFYLYYKYDKEKEEKETVKKLVGLVACLTLLVELLAKGANFSGTKIKQYYDSLVANGFTFPKTKVQTDHNETNQTIEEHVRLLYNISTVTHEESRILQIFSYLPARTMPVEFSDWIECDRNDLVHLSELGWLSATQDGYFMHQVIGDAIRLNNCDKNYLDVFVKLIISGKFFNNAEDFNKTGLKLQIANSVMKWYSFDNNEELAGMYSYVAGAYTNQGDYDKALEYCNKALLICEKVFGTEHTDTATTYNNIAGVYQYRGDYDKALMFYNKALLIREKVFGTYHTHTATTYNNIAVVYQYRGDYDKALTFFKKALLIREKVFGTEHPESATTYNNIACVYRYRGDYDKALAFYNKALLIREKVFGTDHPDTSTTYNNIAGVYQYQGDYSKALTFYNKALLIREKVFGTDHPDTSTTYNNIAGVHHYQGDYDKALTFYNKALLICERVFGTKHPDTATSYNNIAIVYQALGDYDKALTFLNKALLIREKVFSTKHPDTATSYNTIASVYQYQGDYDKALTFFNKALLIREKVFGTDHPDTATIYNNIAVVYYYQNHLTKALEYYRKTQQILEKSLGFIHPRTKIVLDNIADLEKESKTIL